MVSTTKKNILRISIVAFLILLISVLYYLEPQEEVVWHLIYRELYLLPVFLAGFWFGLRGGLAAAFGITVLYMPDVIRSSSGSIPDDFAGIFEVVLFIILGGLIGWLRDREKANQEMRRREEGLAAMGKAVAFVAHDMKTPLMAIGGLCLQIRRKLEPEDAVGKKLDIIVQQTQRLETMIKDLLAFARPLELEWHEGEVSNFLQEILPVAKELAGKYNVNLKLALEDDQVRFFYDPNRLQQALLNLINNAVEASSARETVIIRTRMDDSRNLVIEVQDQGPGISTAIIDDIFQPFVSKKKEGTGLGLPICKKIIEAHGGELQYEQLEGRGMIFRLILPKR
ncbi:ATP-binding protein [Desulfopila inferna]|uniref:ATP-binding protein n=1 Tax=Desulfopila inferna TaxID=468528 RepID=UPI00196559E9|nr:ATP-binding protein [Desulfopila inferna]MBM9605650.1 GHKL domain-containing protein [Desulfopila inferna]